MGRGHRQGVDPGTSEHSRGGGRGGESADSPARTLGLLPHVTEGPGLTRPGLAFHRHETVRAREDVAGDLELVLDKAIPAFGSGESGSPPTAALDR